MNNLGNLFYVKGDYPRCEQLFKEVLDARKKTLSPAGEGERRERGGGEAGERGAGESRPRPPQCAVRAPVHFLHPLPCPVDRFLAHAVPPPPPPPPF